MCSWTMLKKHAFRFTEIQKTNLNHEEFELGFTSGSSAHSSSSLDNPATFLKPKSGKNVRTWWTFGVITSVGSLQWQNVTETGISWPSNWCILNLHLTLQLKKELGVLRALVGGADEVEEKRFGCWLLLVDDMLIIVGGAKKVTNIVKTWADVLTLLLQPINNLFQVEKVEQCQEQDKVYWSKNTIIPLDQHIHTKPLPPALISFAWLFSTVGFQMSPQIACIRGCKVTLIAFVWLFSTVGFQMFPQSVCRGGGVATLVALVWLVSCYVYF